MKKILPLILALIFLVQTISAYTYLNIYIDSTGKAQLLGETNQTNLVLPSGVLVQNGKINGFTQALTSKSGEIWTFSYALTDAEIKVILPDGTKIESLSNPSAEIFLERERISIYYTNSLTVKYKVNPQTSSNPVLWIIVILAIAFGFVAYFYKNKVKGFLKPKIIYQKPKIKRSDKIDLIRHVLNQREQIILDKLKSTGKIKMSHLRKLCEIPKASFSRHVQELERKKLVLRSGEGKNKFVELTKKF